MVKQQVTKITKKVKEEMRLKAERKKQRDKIRNEAEMRKSGRRATRPPNFKTKKVDYSEMRTIKIDKKTTIYAKPGEDVEAVKAKFLKNYKIVAE